MEQYDEVKITQEGARERERLAQLRAAGQDAAVETNHLDAIEAFIEELRSAPARVADAANKGRGGGSSTAGGKTRAKRGTRICGCTLELKVCEHGRKRGPLSARDRGEEEKTVKLRAYLPAEQKRFLTERRFSMTNVLEAVLDSGAMACWRQHDYVRYRQQYERYLCDDDGSILTDENGNEITETVTALSERLDQIRWSDREQTVKRHKFLETLAPTGRRNIDEHMTNTLREKFRRIGRSAPQPKKQEFNGFFLRTPSKRYSDNAFASYCVGYFRETLELLTDQEKLLPKRELLKRVRDVATKCWKCQRD